MNRIKNFILPVLFFAWIAVIDLFYLREVFLQYECCNELKYLNNYEVMVINALPFIVVSALLVIVQFKIKIKNKILIREIIPIILTGLFGVGITVFCYYDSKDMLHEMNNMYYEMIESIIYLVLIALVTLSGLIRCLIESIRSYMKEDR